MKKITVIIAALIVFTWLAGCEKKADNTAVWVGTYTGTGSDSINKVIISKVNNSTLSVQFLSHTDTTVYTFGTLQSATVLSANNIVFNENDSLYLYGGDYYNITGTGVLNGNSLTLNDTAKNTVSNNPLIIFSFTGSK